jgi:hypothetical protein
LRFDVSPKMQNVLSCVSALCWTLASVRYASSRCSHIRVTQFTEARLFYDRVLAYVWLPHGKMFNEVLVREGYAQVGTFPT